jgi:3-oxoacyl-[acyl-carrier-protein] synthase II
MSKRAVITGIGLLTPLGVGREASWSGLVQGKSGIRPFTQFDANRLRTRFGGEVPGFDPLLTIDKPTARRTDRYTQFALAAADEAVADAGLSIDTGRAARVAVLLGVALGGLASLEHHHALLLEKGPDKMNPFMVPMMLANTAPGMLAIRYGARGPNYTVTSACASGAHAIGESLELIRRGVVDVAITGGVEAVLTELCSAPCARFPRATRSPSARAVRLPWAATAS